MKTFLFIILFADILLPQAKIPSYYTKDSSFSGEIRSIVNDLGIGGDYNVGEDGTEQISFAVIDLTGDKPVIGGYNMENFIYPASVYKMYVAMEILKQISEGKISLYQQYMAKIPNVVDQSKQIETDPRPLLKDNDTVTINYLLDLMITRSDNSAANCLIDVAGRENINKTMQDYGWEGSEVTRKFLSRKFEDPGYEKIRGTETCALHSADFMYRIWKFQLVNYWVSSQMKTLLGRQLDKSKLAQGFPKDAMFFHKTGWWSYWTNDAGVVSNGKITFVIACFLPIEEEKALPIFKEIAERVYNLVEKRH